MADYDLNSFDLTQPQLDALGGDPSLISYIRVWDPNDTPGSLVVALSPTAAQVVCPKPCGN
jgi:hypothetical protein